MHFHFQTWFIVVCTSQVVLLHLAATKYGTPFAAWSDMACTVVPVGVLSANCVIIKDPCSSECVIVDPGGDGETIWDICSGEGGNECFLKYILITHGHFDHVMSIPYIFEKARSQQVVPPTVLIHSKDKALYEALEQQCKMFGIRLPNNSASMPPSVGVSDGSSVTFGTENSFCCQFIHTPGHTEGSSSILVSHKQDKVAPFLCSGDTLFRFGVGRTDLPGGSYKNLVASISSRLYSLPLDLRVIPGHGPETTIGVEMANNPFVRSDHPPKATCDACSRL